MSSKLNKNMELISLITKFQLELEKDVSSSIESTSTEYKIDTVIKEALKRGVNGEIKNKSRMMLQDFRIKGVTSTAPNATDSDKIELMKAKQKISQLEALLEAKNVPKGSFVKFQHQMSQSKLERENKEKVLQLEVQVQKLKAENELKIIKAIKAYSIKVAKLEGELQEKNDWLKQKDDLLKKANFEIFNLKELKNDIIELNDEHTKQISAFKKRIRSLQITSTENELLTRIKELETKLNQKEEQLADNILKKEKLHQTLTTIERELSSREITFEMMSTENTKLKSRIEEAMATKVTMNQQIHALNSALESAKTRKTSDMSISQEIKLKEQVQQLETENKRLNDILANSTSASDVYNKTLEQKNKQISELKTEISRLSQEIKTVSLERYELKQDLIASKDQERKTKSEYKTQIKQIKDLENKADVFKNELINVKNKLNAYNQIEDQLRSANGTLQDKLAKQNESNRNLRISFTELQNNIQLLQDENQMLLKENRVLSTDINDLNERLNSNKMKLKNQEIALRSKQKEIEKLYEEIEHVRSYTSDENEFIQENDALKQEKIKLEQNLLQHLEEAKQTKEEIKKLQMDQAESLKNLATKNQRIKELELENSKLNREILTAKAQITSLMNQITENEKKTMTTSASSQSDNFEKAALQSELSQWKQEYQNIKSKFDQYKITTDAQLDEFRAVSYSNKVVDKYKTAITIMRGILEREPYYAILFRLQERKNMSLKELNALTATESVLFKRIINLLQNEGWVEIQGDDVTIKREFVPI